MLRKLAILLVCLGTALIAQSQQGTLSGTLAGLNGKTNAVLILTNTATGASQRITPNPDGSFTVALPPGNYKVEVEREGFRQTGRQNIDVTAGINTQVNVAIEGGPTIEAVEIKANALGTKEGSEIGEGFTSSTVRTVPVFDRNYQELIGNMSGITPPVSSFPLTTDPQRNRQWATNGLPPFTNDYVSNGISVREPFTNELAIRVMPDEAIQQLNAMTSTHSAREGFATGTISNVLPRPGTNGVHGSVFGFISDNFFRTRNPFVIDGSPQPTLHYRQFGGTAGGAIVPDRLFFFLSYQGNINDGSTAQFATVPTAAELAGNFSGAGFPIYNPFTGLLSGIGRNQFPGGIILPSNFNPVSAAYLSYLPAANLPGSANNLQQNVHYIDRGNVLDGRMDYHLPNNTNAFLSYGWSKFNATQNSIFGPVIGGGTLDTLRNHHASGSIAGTYHGVITELRVGYSRYRNLISPNENTAALSSQLSALGFTTGTSNIVPGITVTGLGTLGTPANLPAKDVDNDYEGDANFHIYHGRNEIVFGLNVRDLTSHGFPNFAFGSAGSFSFGPGATALPSAAIPPQGAFQQSFAAFLIGAPSVSGLFSPTIAPSYHQRQFAGFAGDLVRFKHLTLDIGLRYETYSGVNLNNASLYNLSTNTISPVSTVGDYHHNFNPRVGIAIPISERTVIRTSYTITSFPLPFSLLPINIAGAGTSFGVPGTYAYAPFAVPPAVPGSTTPSSIPYFANNLNRDPYVQSYYFMIQQSAPAGFLLNAAYLGNTTRDMPYIKNINTAFPGSGAAGMPLIGIGQTQPLYLEGNGLTSHYNSLQVVLSKRLSKGASFVGAYTWSKSLDYASNGIYLFNPFNTSANYAASDWDRLHMLTISHVFDLSFGHPNDRWNQGVLGKVLGNWKLNGVFHWATGTPYNIYADPLGCACPGTPVNPASAVPGANVNGQASFNPALFTAPATASFGTLGRNPVRGPNLTIYNLSLFKTFPVKENTSVELRAEAYNLLNSTQYGTPYSNVSLPNFGGQTSQTLLNGLFGGAGRTFILGARILF